MCHLGEMMPRWRPGVAPDPIWPSKAAQISHLQHAGKQRVPRGHRGRLASLKEAVEWGRLAMDPRLIADLHPIGIIIGIMFLRSNIPSPSLG
jgi:hypothetical protein